VWFSDNIHIFETYKHTVENIPKLLSPKLYLGFALGKALVRLKNLGKFPLRFRELRKYKK
jgi:hypothetical protein